MLRRLTRHPAVIGLGIRLLGLYLALVYRTTRWTVEAEEAVAALNAGPGPVIGSFWHERLPLAPRVWLEVRRRVPRLAGTRSVVLISRHRDGRFITAVIRRFGIDVVHGSTSRGGGPGLLALLRVLDAGGTAVITPDGPRGPRRVAAPGVAELAARSGAAVYPCAAATARGIALRSWDRMVVPLPFGRGAMVVMPPIRVPPDGAEAALPVTAAAMTEAADRADALVGRAPVPARGGRPA